MKSLLEDNFRAKVVFSKWHWKHSILPMRPDAGMIFTPPAPLVVVYKTPSAFNVSLFGYWSKTRAYMMPEGETLPGFIRRELIVHDDTFRSRAPHYLFATPTDYWNQFHYPYLHWQENQANIHFVAYADLIADPHAVLSDLQQKLGLKRRGQGVMRLPKRHAIPSSDSERSGFIPPPAETAPPPVLSPEDEAFIRDRTHPVLKMALLGETSASDRDGMPGQQLIQQRPRLGASAHSAQGPVDELAPQADAV